MVGFKSPRERALAEVAKAESVVTRWDAAAATATAELDSLEATMADVVLADETAADRLPAQMSALRDRAAVARATADGARPRILVARRRVLELDADALQPAIDEQHRLLAAHDAETEKLQKAIEDHTGERWRAGLTQDEIRHLVVDLGETVTTAPKRLRYTGEVEQLQRQQAILRAVSAGQDPRRVLVEGPVWDRRAVQLTATDYPPAVWGPDAVIPAPQYLETMAGAEKAHRLADEDLADLDEKLARLRAGEHLEPHEFGHGVQVPVGLTPAAERQLMLEQGRARRDAMRGQLERAQASAA